MAALGKKSLPPSFWACQMVFSFCELKFWTRKISESLCLWKICIVLNCSKHQICEFFNVCESGVQKNSSVF